MSRTILSKYKAEVEAATAPAEVARGCHDEKKDGTDERKDEPWWYECK